MNNIKRWNEVESGGVSEVGEVDGENEEYFGSDGGCKKCSAN